MLTIPAGCFEMGDHFGDGDFNEDPVHNVCISAFEMDVHEVTNAEYAECVADGSCSVPHDTASLTRPAYYGNPAYGGFPIIWVSWTQALDYCTWARKRLPTEAEWEYAARGGLPGKRYPWGGDSANCEDDISCEDACYARYDSTDDCWNHCIDGVCENDTHPVGTYEPNAYGLHDMAGNVWEWVQDWYDPDYYAVSPVQDPLGPADGSVRVFRGGSWINSYGRTLRVANRGWFSGEQFNVVGFRCARRGAYVGQCNDNDVDGYGDPASDFCIRPTIDCDDAHGEVYPGAPELCDELDNQCPGDDGYGQIDEGCPDCIPSLQACESDGDCAEGKSCLTTDLPVKVCVEAGNGCQPEMCGDPTFFPGACPIPEGVSCCTGQCTAIEVFGAWDGSYCVVQ